MKYRNICICVLLLCMLSGCFLRDRTTPYEFRQEFDQIASIEILRKETDSVLTDTPTHIIYTLNEADYKSFLDRLMEIEGGYAGSEPGTGFGMYMIRITYQDGEMEMIGNYNNGYITPSGEVHQDVYRFDANQYYAFLSDVLGKEITDWYYH